MVARGHKREEVLVLEKVLRSVGEHPVEWVDQLGVELAKGELTHVVGKIECYSHVTLLVFFFFFTLFFPN